MVTSVACPTDQAIAAFVEGVPSPAERTTIARHVDSCARCFELVATLATLKDRPAPEVDVALLDAAVRPEAAPRRWPRLPALAAVAAVAVAVVWWRLPGPPARVFPATPPAVSALASPAESTRAITESPVTVEQPKDGDVLTDRSEIRWAGPAETVTYEVLVTSAAGDLLWHRRVPADVHSLKLGISLPAGSSCVWVRAYLPEGRGLTSNVVRVRPAGL